MLRIDQKQNWKTFVFIVFLLVFSVMISACEGIPQLNSKTKQQRQDISQQTNLIKVALDVQEAVMEAWSASPHGNTYDLGKGPNTYCSRCHSPQNWDPASKPDAPPNCVTCKFPFDPELRIAKTMDFVKEEDWHGIYCDTCHILEDEVVTEGNAWFNPLTKEYDEVRTPNELCAKCHLNSQGVSSTRGQGVTHEIYLGGSAHKNWAGVLTSEHRPEYCTDCHDPHTQIPKTCESCHDDVLSSSMHIQGYNDEHKKVNCMACHDATGAEVGPHPDDAMGGIWVTLQTEAGQGGVDFQSPIVSHSPQWQVACDRCHFEENPWKLSVLSADG